MKKGIAFALTLLLAFTLAACSVSGISQADYDAVVAERDDYQVQAEEHLEALGVAQNELAAKELELEDTLAELATAQREAEAEKKKTAGLEEELDSLKAEKAELEAAAATRAAPAQTQQQQVAPVAETTVQQPAPAPAEQPAAGPLVWIPRTGSKYHSHAGCSNMKNPSQVSLDTAIASGYGACKKCY